MSRKNAICITLNEHDLHRLIRGQTLTICSGVNPTAEISLDHISLDRIKSIVDEICLLEEGRKLGVLIT